MKIIKNTFGLLKLLTTFLLKLTSKKVENSGGFSDDGE